MNAKTENAQRMNWETRKRHKSATSSDEQIWYAIRPKKNGKFYVDASLVGGADYRLPYREFEDVMAAQQWVEQHESERAVKNARRRAEKPIRF
jgi:hypothetical protein